MAAAEKSVHFSNYKTNHASSSLQYQKLKTQLAREEATSIFHSNGSLKQNVVDNSKEIIPFGRLRNSDIPQGYSKYSTKRFTRPNGKFEVHYYKHPETGEVFYGLDYQSILSNGN